MKVTCNTMKFAMEKKFIRYNEYDLLWRIYVIGNEKYVIEYCPFCGKKL